MKISLYSTFIQRNWVQSIIIVVTNISTKKIIKRIIFKKSVAVLSSLIITGGNSFDGINLTVQEECDTQFLWEYIKNEGSLIQWII